MANLHGTDTTHNETERAELKPCPFCGSDCSHIQEQFGVYEPGCPHCGTYIGQYSSRRSAATAWNRRALLSSDAKPVQDDELIDCPECGGQGYDADVTTDGVFRDTCPHCSGKGLISPALLAEDKAGGEAVAWQRRRRAVCVDNLGPHAWSDWEDCQEHFAKAHLEMPIYGGVETEVRGLFAQPQQTAQQSVNPLTEEQIEAIADRFTRKLGGDHWYKGEDGIADYEGFARAIEAAMLKEGK